MSLCQKSDSLWPPRQLVCQVLKTARTLIGHGSVSGVLLLDRYAKPQVARLRRVVFRAENIVLGKQ